MLQRLAAWDRGAFDAINHGRNAVFDWLMPILSDDGKFKIPFLLLFLALLVFGRSRARTAALLVIPLIALSDQASSNLLKHSVQRVRPCHVLENVHLQAGCSDSYSMPSSHAANSGAAAFHFSFFYPALAPGLVLLALAIGYSRVYVGVHYPGDVLVGLMVGLGAAAAIRGALALGRRVGSRVAARRRRPPGAGT